MISNGDGSRVVAIDIGIRIGTREKSNVLINRFPRANGILQKKESLDGTYST